MIKLKESKLSDDNLELLKQKLKDVSVTGLESSVNLGNRRIKYLIDDIYRNPNHHNKDGKIVSRIEVYLVPDQPMVSSKRIGLAELLKSSNYSASPTSKLYALRKYISENKDNGKDFFEIVSEWVENDGFVDPTIDFNIQAGDELDWLKQHVTGIKARLPRKYSRAFERAFPGQPYTLDNDSWAIGLRMYFDEVDDIPASLLTVTNNNGTPIDLEHKVMNNTSYIWNLVKNHPEDFKFTPISSRE